MTWKILVTAPYMQPVIEQYREMMEQLGGPVELIVPPVRERLSEEELLDWITDVDGAICGDGAFTERVMQAAPKLTVIPQGGTGGDSLATRAARRRPPAMPDQGGPRAQAERRQGPIAPERGASADSADSDHRNRSTRPRTFGVALIFAR